MLAAFNIFRREEQQRLSAASSSHSEAAAAESKSVAEDVASLTSYGVGREQAQASPSLSRKAEAALDDAVIQHDMSERCCLKCCLRNLSFNQLHALREFYARLGNEAEKLKWLVHLVRERGEHGGSDDAPLFSLFGKRVCARAFLRAYRISSHKYYHALALAHAGAPAGGLVHVNVGSGAPSEAGARALAWMAAFFLRHCDLVGASRWVLPAAEDFHSLWELYAADAALHGLSGTVSSSSFQRLRASSFPQVVRARVGDLARCNRCVQLRSIRAQSRSENELERAAAMLVEHRKVHGDERALLQATALRARRDRNVLLLHVDYASSLALPHFPQRPKVRVFFACRRRFRVLIVWRGACRCLNACMAWTFAWPALMTAARKRRSSFSIFKRSPRTRMLC